MKHRSAILSFFAISIALLTSQSAIAQREGVTMGSGMEVCNRILANMKENHVGSNYTEWVSGYISAYNLFGDQKQIDEMPDSESIDLFLQKYCRANPMDKVIWASMSLITELGGYHPPYLQSPNQEKKNFP
jgi:hypothetical protein